MIQHKYFGDSRDYLKCDLIKMLLKNPALRHYVFIPAYSSEFRHQFQFNPATDSSQNPPHETSASSSRRMSHGCKERPVELADLDGSRSARSSPLG